MIRPFGIGADGLHVRDLQHRLAAAGFDPGPATGVFDKATSEAVKAFQSYRSIDVDGICGTQTWQLLVEAGHRLGDRLLYLRTPFMRGDDVTEVQRMLSMLGFSVGRIDGIWGPSTASALTDFQMNLDLADDGICGRATVAHLERLIRPLGNATVVAHLTEQRRLDIDQQHLLGRRIAVGEPGGLDPIAAAVRRTLGHLGAEVLVTHHPDWGTQATRANRFGASVYVAFEVKDEAPSVCYFEGQHYVSYAGRSLANGIAEGLEPKFGGMRRRGMGLQILRESVMPAVLCRFDRTETLVHNAAHVASVISTATYNLLTHNPDNA